MSLSTSERQEFEQIVRAALEPALHDLESRIAEGFAEACDMWANLLADLMMQQAEIAMKVNGENRAEFLRQMEEREKQRAANRQKVGGFTG